MRRMLVIASALAILLIGAALWLAPATWLDHALQRGSRGALSLTDAQGRVWQGSGTLQAILPGVEVIAIDRVRWTVVATELVQGRLRFSLLSVATGKLLVDASLSRAGFTLHSSQLEVPAALLATISPTLREAALAGKLSITAKEFRWAHQQADGTAEIVWNNAASSLVRVNPLGSYRIEIKGAADGVTCRISTIGSGALKLSGTCQLLPGRPFGLDATAEAGENYQRELTPLLRIFGKETRPGVYQLQAASGIGFE